MRNKILTIGLIAGIVLSAGIFAVKAFNTSEQVAQVCEAGATCNFNEAVDERMCEAGDLGAITTRDYFDSAEGYYVDGSAVINGSGVVVGSVSGTSGAFSSTLDVTGNTRVAGDFNKTGADLDATTTMTVAFTLTAAQVCDSNVIRVNSAAVNTTLSAASLDITLPATSTLFADCLSTDGDSRIILFCNQSPTAATTTQIVTGAGIKLVEPDGQNIEIAGGACADIKITRTILSVTENAVASVDELIDAD